MEQCLLPDIGVVHTEYRESQSESPNEFHNAQFVMDIQVQIMYEMQTKKLR